MRKTKIVCTMGPSTADDNVLRELMKAGMNVARQNFSHGGHESHLKTFQQVKRIREELGLPVASLLDTKGPEVRVKLFKDGKAELKDGSVFTLTTREVEGSSEEVSITYKNLAKDIDVGAKILADDGLIEMKVTEIDTKPEGDDIKCLIVHGGWLSNNKSCNFPGAKLSMPYVSERDKSDIIFGAQTGFDFIAASFVSCDADILEVRRILEENGGKDIKIIAKIENQEGVDNIDDILRVSDGIMVARGDMGVEIPFEQIPQLQKMLIEKGYNAGKQVITATQMLESMIKNPRPTRAETTDVANAIYDGTSAIMLSGETAAGMYPVEAVKTMALIAENTENNINYSKRFRSREVDSAENVTNAISHATVTTALDLNAKAILTVTTTGGTAKLLSKYRPNRPILSCTPSERTWRQLSLSWGVIPLMSRIMETTDDLFNHAVECAVNEGYLENGDLVVITAGVPLGISGTTNLMKVHVVGDVLVMGDGITDKTATAQLCVARTPEEAVRNFVNGDILVIPETSNDIMRILRAAKGIITEKGGADSHAAVVGLSLDIPVIVGAENATRILKSGTTVTIDAERGIVSSGS
ncbi:MAG: pyruvate kinase [Bacteroides sp.]|nr:pyruvate kinase [Bacteroides sp.]